MSDTEWGVRYTPVDAEAIEWSGPNPWVAPFGVGKRAEVEARQVATLTGGGVTREAVSRPTTELAGWQVAS